MYSIEKIKEKKFKVVIDTVNGAAYKALPELLEKLNCDIIKIHCENTGDFPRGTEPIPSHLGDLSKTVREEKADIGFATDPDADRLAIVSNTGFPIGEESTLVLALESYLKFYKDSQTIVTNLSTSMGVDAIAERYNSTVERSSVGEINVVEKMKEFGSAIGGEGNGGVILKESHLGRDSLVASALVLNHLAHSNISLDKILENTPRFVMIKDKIPIENDVNFNDIKAYFKNDIATFIDEDGLKIIWEDKWVHIRKSNTEPIIRIISEANDNNTAESLIDLINKIVSYSGP
jgi:phosphomannomutase